MRNVLNVAVLLSNTIHSRSGTVVLKAIAVGWKRRPLSPFAAL